MDPMCLSLFLVFFVFVFFVFVFFVFVFFVSSGTVVAGVCGTGIGNDDWLLLSRLLLTHVLSNLCRVTIGLDLTQPQGDKSHEGGQQGRRVVVGGGERRNRHTVRICVPIMTMECSFTTPHIPYDLSFHSSHSITDVSVGCNP